MEVAYLGADSSMGGMCVLLNGDVLNYKIKLKFCQVLTRRRKLSIVDEYAQENCL